MGAYENWNKLKKSLQITVDNSGGSGGEMFIPRIILDEMNKMEEYENGQMNDRIHDCYREVLGETPSEDEIKRISHIIDEDIKHHADQWGWSDTEVGDMVYEWIEKNYKVNNPQDIRITQVFNSYSMFPKMWHECLTEAQNKGYKYIDFNGMIFHTIPQSPELENAICLREDLMQEEC